MKTRDKILLIYLMTSLIIISLLSSSCCYNLNKITEQVEKKEEITQKTNTPPVARIDIAQEDSDGYYFEKGKQILLSGSNSMDPDEDELTFVWKIEDGPEIPEEETTCVPDSTGEYTIELTVSDGVFSDTAYKKIKIIEATDLLMLLKEHKCSVEIEYTLENKGPGEVVDVQCRVEVPKTQLPFQIVEERSTDSNSFEELTDEQGNIIYKFVLNDIAEGESASVKVSCDITIYEFDYKDYSDDMPVTYGPDDKDVQLYTKSEKYINSDSPEIIKKADLIAGGESNPYRKAEKLYGFVVDKLEYDFEKLEEIETLSVSETETPNASEILETDKGICTDYATLFTALCRASGIPARFVQGIPVSSILQEENKQLSNGHAWVEIKLPVYGWVPIDVTAESGFMSYNYSLNLETYKGSGWSYESLIIDDNKYYPSGFNYNWLENTEPVVEQKIIYSVSGLDPDDLSFVSENEFLDKIYGILSEYTTAVNHVNSAHAENWIFNDPKEISLEETFLVKLQELSDKLKKFSYPQIYTEDRNNLVKISEEICIYKQAQIDYMRNDNYESNIDSYNKFTEALDSLFYYYNDMLDAFNSKY